MKISMPKAVQITIFILFALALVAMSCGATIVPKDPETQKLFYVILGIFTTLLSVQTLTAAIQREDGFAPLPAPPTPPAAEESAAPPATGEGGFARLRFLIFVLCLGLVLLVLQGCASVTQNISCGEMGRDVKQTTTDKTALDGNSAKVDPNISLVPK